MKLQRIKIENSGTGRKLLDNFDMVFDTSLWATDTEGVQPICFVGENGAGKSQLLEVLAEIFFYLDQYFLKKGKDPKTQLRFELEYTIGKGDNERHVMISHLDKKKTTPKVQIYKNDAWEEVVKSEVVHLLPHKVVGYTSGENETLSIPFLDSYTDYADLVAKSAFNKTDDVVEDPLLMLMDYNSNVLIFVANNLLRSPDELKIFEEYVRISGLASFRIVIQLAHSAAPSKTGVLLTKELQTVIDKLQNCATCSNYTPITKTWILDFFVNDATKAAFKHYFGSAFALYTALYKLELLNNLIIEGSEKQKIKKIRKEQRFVMKLPTVTDRDKVFRFEQVRLRLKDVKEAIDYIGLSDGQHQFTHVFGTLMMVDSDNILFILDEPETHFNPRWRSSFVKILNAVSTNNSQVVFLTTHSPFILSDSRRENVYIFKLDETGKQTKVYNPNKETYGASMENLLQDVFGTSVSEVSFEEMRQLQKSDDADAIEEQLDKFGDNIEKFYLLRRIRELRTGNK